MTEKTLRYPTISNHSMDKTMSIVINSKSSGKAFVLKCLIREKIAAG